MTILLVGHRFFTSNIGSIFLHDTSCPCKSYDDMSIDTWKKMTSIERMYYHAPMGLSLEEFAVRMGLAEWVSDDDY